MSSPNRLLTGDSAPTPSLQRRLRGRILPVLFILLCLEIGVVLVLFPWSSLWDRNYFFSLAPQWTALFSSSYLRGAISGVGVVNVWIAISEAWRLRSA
jgi:hypothetical protein